LRPWCLLSLPEAVMVESTWAAFVQMLRLAGVCVSIELAHHRIEFGYALFVNLVMNCHKDSNSVY
jgi:hypothetical protein